MLALGCLSNSHIIKEISDLLKFGDNMVATILNEINKVVRYYRNTGGKIMFKCNGVINVDYLQHLVTYAHFPPNN